MEFKKIQLSELTSDVFDLISKQKMLIAVKDGDKVNAMTAGWGGFGVIWGKNAAFLFIRDSRYTKPLADKAGEMSLCFFDNSKYNDMLAYMGTASGRDEDKIAHCSLSVIEDGESIYFGEAHTAVLLKKMYAVDLTTDHFENSDIPERIYKDGGYHTMYVGEITKVLRKEQ